MMEKFMPAIAASAALLLISLSHSLPAIAGEQEGPPSSVNNWVGDKNKGWFFYNEKDEKEPEKKKTKPPAPTPAPPTPLPDFTKPEPKSDTKSQPPSPFSAEWFRKNLPKYLDRAWNNPTPENVRTYYVLQKIALDRAGRFARTAQEVVMGNPMLDESTNRPIAVAYGRSYDMAARKAMDALMQELSKKFGIAFIFSGKQCTGECITLSRNLKAFSNATGFKVLPISADGENFSQNAYAEFIVDRKAPQKLKIINYPTIALMDLSTKEVIPVAQYALTIESLKKFIALRAKQSGYITDQQLLATRKYRPKVELDSPEFMRRIQQRVGEAEDADGFIPPERLMPLLQDIPLSADILKTGALPNNFKR